MIKIEAAQRLRMQLRAGRETGEGAGALFYCRSTNRYLLLKRSAQGDAPNTWCGLGGGRDRLPSGVFEPIEHTVRREAFEEAEFPMDAECELVFIDTFQHDDGFKFHNFIAVVPDEFEPSLNSEHTDYQWANWEDFPRNVHPKMWEALTSKQGKAALQSIQ